MPDNINNEFKQILQALYSDNSKHSNYQNIPMFVQNAIDYKEDINEEWRGDTARFNYIKDKVIIEKNDVIGDIGANTGFFTLSLAYEHPHTKFFAYEPNQKHAEFIKIIAKYFQLSNVLVVNQAIKLETLKLLKSHDLLLHFNVLHHAGHDYDQSLVKDKSSFKSYAINYLNKLLEYDCKKIVFQMGSNWGGDKSHPLVHYERDVEKFFFLTDLFIESGWKFDNISYPTRDDNNTIIYKDIPREIVQLINSFSQDSFKVLQHKIEDVLDGYCLSQFLGEFYRRPIFICSI